jgi:hypothetical protein
MASTVNWDEIERQYVELEPECKLTQAYLSPFGDESKTILENDTCYSADPNSYASAVPHSPNTFKESRLQSPPILKTDIGC